MEININTDRFVWLTNKLEGMYQSALPNAVRGTLNGMAIDMKKDTLIASSNKEFTNRQKNFFKAKSSINFAKGFNLSMMSSEVGFTGDEQAVEDLEMQEYGGTIKGRRYIPVDESRISKSKGKKVSARNRLGSIGKNNIVKAKDMGGANDGHNFVLAANKAGKGGFFQAKLKKSEMVFRVNSLNKVKGRFKLTAIYFVNQSKTVKVDSTKFMEKAAKKTYAKAPDIYAKEAERQFQRHFK